MNLLIYEKNINDIKKIEKIVKSYIYINNFDIDVIVVNEKNKLLDIINTTEINCLFIGLQLGENELFGLQIGKQVKINNPLTEIVYITSLKNMEKIIMKNKIGAMNYIEKNSDNFVEEIVDSIQVAYSNYLKIVSTSDRIKKLAIKNGDGILFIDYKNILYFEYLGERKIKIICKNKKEYIIQGILKNIDNMSEKFLKVHSAFLVNVENIISLTKDLVYLEEENICPLAKSRNKKVREYINNYYGKN